MCSNTTPFEAEIDPKCYTWISDQTKDYFRQVVCPMVFASICGIGILGNFIVISVIWLKKLTTTVFNMLVVNLAITDLMVLSLTLPLFAHNWMTGIWMFGDIACRSAQYAFNVTANASIYMVVLMAALRYVSVTRPLLEKLYITSGNVKISVCLIWIMSTIICIPTLTLFEAKEYDIDNETSVHCVIYDDNQEFAHSVYYIVISFAFPIILLIVFYTGLVIELWSTGYQKKHDTVNRRVTKICVAIVMTFIVCWLPFRVIDTLFVSRRYQ